MRQSIDTFVKVMRQNFNAKDSIFELQKWTEEYIWKIEEGLHQNFHNWSKTIGEGQPEITTF